MKYLKHYAYVYAWGGNGLEGYSVYLWQVSIESVPLCMLFCIAWIFKIVCIAFIIKK